MTPKIRRNRHRMMLQKKKKKKNNNTCSPVWNSYLSLCVHTSCSYFHRLSNSFCFVPLVYDMFLWILSSTIWQTDWRPTDLWLFRFLSSESNAVTLDARHSIRIATWCAVKMGCRTVIRCSTLKWDEERERGSGEKVVKKRKKKKQIVAKKRRKKKSFQTQLRTAWWYDGGYRRHEPLTKF